MNQNENSDLIKITGLWKRKDRNGNVYLGGKIDESTTLLIFPGKKEFGSEGHQPDYIAYCSTSKGMNGDGGNGNGRSGGILGETLSRRASDTDDLTLF